MNELKVLICDDIRKRCEETAAEIHKVRDKLVSAGIDIKIQELFGKELSKEIKDLFGYVKKQLPPVDTGSFKNIDPFNHAKFDCDIVIIDNNLAALEIEGTRLTAEAVAGFVRAFTGAHYIVSLNKNPEVDFDLRYLVGDYQTQADLALNADHLSNPALWTGNPKDTKDGFLPWYWPALNYVSKKRLEQVKFVKRNMRSAILDTLSFRGRAVDYLSRHAVGALSSEVSDPTDGESDDRSVERTTFVEFFLDSCRSLPVRVERERIAEAASAGSKNAVEIIARVVSAEIDKWIRRDVLGPQDVLVDIPHLLMRMPFVLGGGVCDIDQWDGAMTDTEPPFGMDREIYENHISDIKFMHDVWVKSPCFWWPDLKTNEALNDLFFAAGDEWPDAVFCEDISLFRTVTQNEGEFGPKEFAAEFEGSWSRRYVARLPDWKYAPRSRFAR